MGSEISEMEKADSPLELCDFLYLELKKLKKLNLEKKDLWSQSHFADRLPWPSEANKLYLFFWHTDRQIIYSQFIYSLYEIEVPKPLPPPPTKAAQNAERSNPSCLYPILEFETGTYPEGMCCVQLGSELYFFGGELYLKNAAGGVLPREVYIFYLILYNKYPDLLRRLTGKLLLKTKPMNSGKASPQTFVADEKIYVMGSTFQGLDDKSFAYFEVYDPVEAMWTVLPNPPIRNVNTRWVGNAVVGRKAVLVALQLGQERLYCFNLDTSQWTNRVSIPDFPAGDFFSGKTEFVENTLYGCYFNTIGAIAPLVNNEEEEEEEEWEEWEEEEEEEEVQQIERLLNNYRLHLVSEEMGMDAIFYAPLQLRSSSSLLHLGNRYFCYVRSGTDFLPQDNDYKSYNYRKRLISIIIFQAPVHNENAIAPRFFRANFVYSKHYQLHFPYSKDVVIKGCYALR